MKVTYPYKILISIVLIFFSSYVFASESWVSEVDKRYKNIDYNLYLKVMKAKSLIPGSSSEMKEATKLLNEVINVSPNFAPAYVQVARLISNQRLTKEMIKIMESVLNTALILEPEYGYAMAMMAYTKIRKRELDDAEMYLLKAEQSGTGYPYVKSMWSDLLMRKGKYKEATKIAIEGFNDYKDNPELAVSYIKMIISSLRRIKGNFDELDYWYKKRIELRPNVAFFYFSYSSFLVFHKYNFDAAITNAEKAVNIANSDNARRILATALYCKWSTLDDTPNMEFEATQFFKRATLVDTDLNYLLSQMSKNTYRHNTKTIMPIYIKVLNSKYKTRNAKDDLESGILKQHEYDLITSSP